MSIFGNWIAATIAAGASSSAEIDLLSDYDYLCLQIPSMNKCKLYIQVAETSGGTFYDLGEGTTTDEEIFNRAAIWLLGGWRYIKIRATTGQQVARLIRVRGMRY